MIEVPSSRLLVILDFREKSKNQFGAREISWFVAACNQFLRKDMRRLYPDEPVWTVDHYTSITGIDLANVWPITLSDDDGLPDALGHHYVRWGLIGAAVDCLNRSLDDILSTLLHELEICWNPYIIEWAKLPDNRETPREAGDPVQWSTFEYDVSAKWGGVHQTRTFRTQNMVGARYWDANANGDLDLKGEVTSPHQWPLRGYRVIRDGSKRYNEFGAVEGGTQFSMRKFGPGSRTYHLLREPPELSRADDGLFQAKAGGRMGMGITRADALAALRSALVRL